MSICPSPLESNVFQSLSSRSSRSLSVSPSIFQSCLELLPVGYHGLRRRTLNRLNRRRASQEQMTRMQVKLEEHEIAVVITVSKDHLNAARVKKT
jgi:hypothetical protein